MFHFVFEERRNSLKEKNNLFSPTAGGGSWVFELYHRAFWKTQKPTFFIPTGNIGNRRTKMIQHGRFLGGNYLTESHRLAHDSVTIPLYHEGDVTSHFSAAQPNTGGHISGMRKKFEFPRVEATQ